AVGRVTGELRVLTEIFLPAATKFTSPIGPMQPCHSNAGSRTMLHCAFSRAGNSAHNLVAGNHVSQLRSQLPFHHIKVRPAYSTGAYFDQELIIRRLGYGNVCI